MPSVSSMLSLGLHEPPPALSGFPLPSPSPMKPSERRPEVQRRRARLVGEHVAEDFDAVHPVLAERRLRLRAGDELEVVVDRLGSRIAVRIRLVGDVETATVARAAQALGECDHVVDVAVDRRRRECGRRTGQRDGAGTQCEGENGNPDERMDRSRHPIHGESTSL
jgi:hypothetical protein